jgi:hypothetical protein
MKETRIPCDEALENHGIKCPHGQMSNGEYRFRLIKNDGTAYIRTEASSNGDWQDSHYHNQVRETYIVQNGWMGYAEEIGGEPRYYIYREGQLFTTSPFIIHNVYLPAGAVIHTVKHGDGAGEKRLEDERTDRFTAITRAVSEQKLLELGDCQIRTAEESPAPSFLGTPRPTAESVPAWTYSEAYRHFDDLIWQASVWSTGLFALALAGMTQVSAASQLILTIGVGYNDFVSTISTVFSGFVLVISHALYRFRWHQAHAKGYRPRKPWLSPQVGLQLMVNLQAAGLACVALVLQSTTAFRTAVFVGIGLIAVEAYQEMKVLRVTRVQSLSVRETRS